MSGINYQTWRPEHISFSTIDGYRQCGKRTFLQKVARVEQRPGLAGLGGNAVHSATEVVDLAIFNEGWAVLDIVPDDEEPPF